MIERDEKGTVVHYRGADHSPDCARCPCAVNGKPKERGVVRGYGARGSLTIVGEAPSTEEFRQGYPFVGPSGKELQRCFTRGRIDKQQIFITNALLCQRPWNDADMMTAVDCCRPRLQAELQFMEPTTVLALGATATRALQLRATTVMDARGTVQDSPLLGVAVPVVTSIHPAALFKGGAGEVSGGKQKSNVDAQAMFLQSDVEKAWAISQGTLSPEWSDDITVLGPDAAPADVDLAMVQVVADVREWGMCGIDLEWAKDGRIKWLGLGTPKRAFSFWMPALTEGAAACAKALIADESLPKLVHNRQADKETWEREVGPFEGEPADTMLAHHAAYPGIAHDLQQVVSQHLVVPPWKTWRAQALKAAAVELKERTKAEKKAAKQAAHEARNAERAAEKERKKAERQRLHDEKIELQRAERERKKAEKQAAHEARNAEAANKQPRRGHGYSLSAAAGAAIQPHVPAANAGPSAVPPAAARPDAPGPTPSPAPAAESAPAPQAAPVAPTSGVLPGQLSLLDAPPVPPLQAAAPPAGRVGLIGAAAAKRRLAIVIKDLDGKERTINPADIDK